MTTYRLITVWRDEEQDNSPIQRAVLDFATPEAAEAHILAAKERGLIRVDINEPPLENGFHLIAAYAPIHQVVGWYIWFVPDSAPQEAQA